jgi:hypothetical protein
MNTHAARKKKIPKTNNFFVNHFTPHNPDCPLFQVLHAIVLFSDLMSALPFLDNSYNSFFFQLTLSANSQIPSRYTIDEVDLLWP